MAKLERLLTPSVDTDVGQQELILAGRNAKWHSHYGNSLAISYHITPPSHSWGNGNTCPHKDLYPNIYSGGIHNHPQLATIQTPIDRRTDTQVMGHPDIETLLSNKREQMTARCNRNDSQSIMLSEIKATNCTVPFMWHSGKDNTPTRAKGWVLPKEIYYKGTGGHFWGWQGCPITRLWWWLHHCTHLSKLFQWQT